jgi:uncharacterized protein (DUF2249 family)
MSTDYSTTLDIREIAPHERHSLIFKEFKALAQGQSFQLVNDHDPKPLHHQFQVQEGDGFTWDYLEAGPQVWRVQIGKSAKASGNCCSGGGCCG